MGVEGLLVAGTKARPGQAPTRTYRPPGLPHGRTTRRGAKAAEHGVEALGAGSLRPRRPRGRAPTPWFAAARLPSLPPLSHGVSCVYPNVPSHFGRRAHPKPARPPPTYVSVPPARAQFPDECVCAEAEVRAPPPLGGRVWTRGTATHSQAFQDLRFLVRKKSHVQKSQPAVVCHGQGGTGRTRQRPARRLTATNGSHRGPSVFRNRRALSWETQ